MPKLILLVAILCSILVISHQKTCYQQAKDTLDDAIPHIKYRHLPIYKIHDKKYQCSDGQTNCFQNQAQLKQLFQITRDCQCPTVNVGIGAKQICNFNTGFPGYKTRRINGQSQMVDYNFDRVKFVFEYGNTKNKNNKNVKGWFLQTAFPIG